MKPENFTPATEVSKLKGFDSFDISAVSSTAKAAMEQASPPQEGASRRDFLRSAGIMMVGFAAAGSASKLSAQSPIAPTGLIDATQVDSWVAIGADESVTGYVGKVELGQGMRTIQTQLIAEELSVSMNRINLIMGITGITPDQGSTSGSNSTPTQFGAAGLRAAVDTARDALMLLASEQLDATVDQLEVRDGVVYLKSDPTQNISYGNLVYGKRFNLTMNAKAVPKDPSTWKVLGTSVPRVDIPAKATGQFQYVQQVRVPGMLHGKVVRPSTVGAHFVSMDDSSLAGMPGNPKAIQVMDFVGVVADTEWHAIQAVGALNVEWSAGATLPAQTTLYSSFMTSQPSADSYTVDSGDVDQTMAGAVQVIKAQYLHPYHLHGSIGTTCAVADVRGTGKNAQVRIWSCTQEIYPVRDGVSTLLGFDPAKVQVIFVDGSGCYGLNGADTVAFDAAILSQAVQAPVRVQFSRKDEMTGADTFGPAYIINLKAGVDKNGQMIAWDYEAWSSNKGSRVNATTPGNVITGALLGFPTPTVTVTTTPTRPTTFGNGSNVACNYITGTVNGVAGGTGTVASQRCLGHQIASPFFTGPLRSPARIQNTFANESFIDEVAAALKQDPVQYRLRHINNVELPTGVGGIRLTAVLNSVAQAYGWDTRPSPKPNIPKTGVVTGRGVSAVLYEGSNGYCAMVAEVSVDLSSGMITVTKLVASQDSGPVSNPNGMRNQMEGGALQGLSRAMHEEVKWNNRAGVITSADWLSYPVYQFGDALPEIQSLIINNPTKPSWGSGECTITNVASAIANAVFDATGVRMRQLPFTPANFLAAKGS
jgi:CO/xanthine dehydrogenase Mo-binding subunit